MFSSSRCAGTRTGEVSSASRRSAAYRKSTPSTTVPVVARLKRVTCFRPPGFDACSHRPAPTISAAVIAATDPTADRRKPDPTKRVAQLPDVGGDEREDSGCQSGGQCSRESDRKPPRLVGPDHSDQQSHVPAQDPRREHDAAVPALLLAPELTGAASETGDRARQRVVLRVPEQGAHESHDRVTGASTQSDGAERRQAHDRHAVQRAGVGHDRAPMSPERQIGEADDQIPGLLQEPLPCRGDEGGVVGRWMDEDVDHRRHPPLDGGQLHTQLCAQIVGEVRRNLGGRTRSRDESDHHLAGRSRECGRAARMVPTVLRHATSVGSRARREARGATGWRGRGAEGGAAGPLRSVRARAGCGAPLPSWSRRPRGSLRPTPGRCRVRRRRSPPTRRTRPARTGRCSPATR